MLARQAALLTDPRCIQATRFDGNTYLIRGSALTGAVDDALLLFSTWVRFTGAAGVRNVILYALNGRVSVERTVANRIRIVGEQSGTDTAQFDSTLTLTDRNWHHILIKLNTNFDAGLKIAQIVIDGVLQVNVGVVDARPAFVMNLDAANWTIGGQTTGVAPLFADLADLWVAFGSDLDLSVAANVQKFRKANGRPADLGADGTAPGITPILFHRGGAAAFATNLGTGGGMTVNAGALLNAKGPVA